jgi:ring-1,2-phenylacetyl-CoA epoxidase subunit PaaD
MRNGDIKNYMMQKQEAEIWQKLEMVKDPEIPVLSIIDLGIVRSIKITESSNNINAFEVYVAVTPTYSACPAVDMINADIKIALSEAGYKNITIEQVLFPAWTTDWMSASGKEKLKKYGIAAPIGKSCDQTALEDLTVICPQCGSDQTKIISAFGSTACKALFQCNNCLEPFDYFKCH